jgi:hypothetical protein
MGDPWISDTNQFELIEWKRYSAHKFLLRDDAKSIQFDMTEWI